MRRRRASHDGRARDREDARKATAPRRSTGSRRQEGRAADKLPCPLVTGLPGPRCVLLLGELARPTTSSISCLRGRRIRLRTGVSARVLARRACEAANPPEPGAMSANWLARGRGSSPEGEVARPTANELHALRRTASAQCKAAPRSASRVSRGRAGSPSAARARHRRAGSPSAARARRRLCAHQVGGAGSASGEPARHWARSLSVGGTSSPSDPPEAQNRRSSPPSGEQIRRWASRLALLRARSTSGVWAPHRAPRLAPG
jgi:hypothetical protein